MRKHLGSWLATEEIHKEMRPLAEQGGASAQLHATTVRRQGETYVYPNNRRLRLRGNSLRM